MVPGTASRRGRGGGRARPAMSAAPAGAAGPRPWALRLAPQTLELLALPCCLEEPEPERRPCISDDLKIGYYSTDHAMQTDIKEIPELKELAIATQALIKLVHSLQQDLFTYKSIIQAQYEEKIEEQASNLCKYINDCRGLTPDNDQLTDIEFLHKQKEVQIRQSCRQQLWDALAVLRANIEKYYNINGEDTAFSPGKLLKLLRNKLHEEESITEDLERKKRKDCIAIFQIVFEDDDHEKKMLEKENEDFKEEVFKLHNEISHLENALKCSEKEKYLLDKQVQRMRSKMEADEQTAQQLIEIQEQVKAELENERPLVKNLITYVVPEQQAAERTLTAETEKLKKHKGQERQTTERKEAEQSNIIWKKKFQILHNRFSIIALMVACPVCIENDTRDMKGFRAGLYWPSTLPPIYSQSTEERKEDKG
ncbi:uncharacterized protein C10orf67 homolog, mitochondrial [Gymnogyps californianus]|uniref:uncharacterized protein C10orf67 homolog, mitochondrial n=1 Tax=Gymnogyps californianus TaxID=33616 RepID=UPI0021CA2542|nr:uncharacterized protein C10orf67 homolog, mitochondrial [Gymnogyps californianus]